jgi:hypothetical protein
VNIAAREAATLALRTSGFVLGLVANAAGLGPMFLVSALVVLCAAGVGSPMMRGRDA